MNPTEARDSAASLAPGNAKQALAKALTIKDPWFRAQALAFVLRYIDRGRIHEVAKLAAAAIASTDDDYKGSAVAAWPIRALIEREYSHMAQTMLDVALARAAIATPHSSRASALALLLQAAWPLGKATRRSISSAIAQVEREDGFWRVREALLDAVEWLVPTDLDHATELADGIADEKSQRKARRSIEQPRGHEPRSFF